MSEKTHGYHELSHNIRYLIVKIPGNSEFYVGDKWDYDQEKNNFAIQNNYSIFVVWEHDLKTNKDLTLNKILKYATS